MANVLRISGAATLALHTTAFLAQHNKSPIPINEIANTLCSSPAHLSKVLQRLAKVNLVKSTRGPEGGFTLGKNASKITLLEVYEAIEGRFVESDCLLWHRICKGRCILGGFIGKINKQVKKYLSQTRLNEIKLSLGRSGNGKKEDGKNR